MSLTIVNDKEPEMSTPEGPLDDGERGGDPPCWAHVFDDQGSDESPNQQDGLLVVDLREESMASGGVVWSLPHGGDLDANLVRLDPGSGIGSHVNNDVDVLIVVQSGGGELTVDHQVRQLATGHVALVQKGTRRSILAGDDGLGYLSIHRQRSPLGLTRRAT